MSKKILALCAFFIYNTNMLATSYGIYNNTDKGVIVTFYWEALDKASGTSEQTGTKKYTGSIERKVTAKSWDKFTINSCKRKSFGVCTEYDSFCIVKVEVKWAERLLGPLSSKTTTMKDCGNYNWWIQPDYSVVCALDWDHCPKK